MGVRWLASVEKRIMGAKRSLDSSSLLRVEYAT